MKCPFVLFEERLEETLTESQVFALESMPFFRDLELACVQGVPFRIHNKSESEFSIDVFHAGPGPTHYTLNLQPET